MGTCILYSDCEWNKSHHASYAWSQHICELLVTQTWAVLVIFVPLLEVICYLFTLWLQTTKWFPSKGKPTQLRLFASSFDCKGWTLHCSTGKAKFVTVNSCIFLQWLSQWVTKFSECAIVLIKREQTVVNQFECLGSQWETYLFLTYSWNSASIKQCFIEITDLGTVIWKKILPRHIVRKEENVGEGNKWCCLQKNKVLTELWLMLFQLCIQNSHDLEWTPFVKLPPGEKRNIDWFNCPL